MSLPLNSVRKSFSVLCRQDLSDIIVYLSKIIYQCVAVPFLQQKWVHTLLLLAITGSWGCTRVAFLGFAVYKGWAYGIIKDYRTFDFKISYGCVKFGVLPCFQPPSTAQTKPKAWMGTCALVRGQLRYNT